MKTVKIRYAGVEQTIRLSNDEAPTVNQLVQGPRVKADPLFSYGDNIRITANGAEVSGDTPVTDDMDLKIEHRCSTKG